MFWSMLSLGVWKLFVFTSRCWSKIRASVNLVTVKGYIWLRKKPWTLHQKSFKSYKNKWLSRANLGFINCKIGCKCFKKLLTLWAGKLLFWGLVSSGTALFGECEWWKHHAGMGDEARSPRSDDASTRKQLSLGLCLVLVCTEESSLMEVCFSSYCCFCGWENSNHLVFPHLETLPCAVASPQGPNSITDLSVDHPSCTSLNKVPTVRLWKMF